MMGVCIWAWSKGPCGRGQMERMVDGGWWMAEGLDTWTCIWNQKSRWEGRDDKDGVKLDKFLVGVLERKKLAW